MNREIPLVYAVGIIGAVLLGIAGLFLPFIGTPSHVASVSPSGSTFSTQRGLGVAGWTPSNGATSTSIQNLTGQDVVVTGCFAQTETATTSYTAVTNTGLASFNIKAATTSTNAPAVVTNTNFVLNMNIATGTSAAGGTPFPQILQSTSTAVSAAAGISALPFMVPANAYLTFFANATTSSTYSVFCPYLSN